MLAKDSTAGSSTPRAGAGGDGLGDRVLGGVLERAGESQAPRRGGAVGGDDVDERHPAGGDGAGLVEHDRVDLAGRLEHLGPLMRMPSWAPRPVPTISAVGVASPRAHGQAMISTATAAVKATWRSLAGAEPEPEGADGEGDDDGHEHGRDPVGEALHGGLAGLGVR